MNAPVPGFGILLAASLAAGCSSNAAHIAKLRATLDEAEVSLGDGVAVAEGQSAAAYRAALLVDAEPVFSVRATAHSETRRYRIDLAGKLVSATRAGEPGGLCPGSISLGQAIGAAEAEAGGQAVAIVPDDDVSCAFEVQVLTPDTLWEVKVGSAGQVLESEESDEDGSGD